MTSQPEQSQSVPRERESRPPRSNASQRLQQALSEYRSRYSPGHAEAVRGITAAVADFAREMKASHAESAAMIVSLKAILAEYPASALIHPDAVRRSIEHYYERSTEEVHQEELGSAIP